MSFQQGRNKLTVDTHVVCATVLRLVSNVAFIPINQIHNLLSSVDEGTYDSVHIYTGFSGRAFSCHQSPAPEIEIQQIRCWEQLYKYRPLDL